MVGCCAIRHRVTARCAAKTARLALLLWIALAAMLAVPALAQDTRQQQLDKLSSELDHIEAATRRPQIDDLELRDLIGQTADVMTAASDLAAGVAGAVAAANAQVKALTPAEGADQPASDELKAELAAAQATQSSLVGIRQRALAIVARGTATQTEINEQRRAIFSARLLGRSQSLLDPRLWIDAGREVPVFAAGIAALGNEWYASFRDGADRWEAFAGSVVIALLLLALIPGRRYVIRRLRRRSQAKPYSSRSKVVTAVLTVAANSLLPATILYGGHAVLSTLHLAPENFSVVWRGAAAALVLYMTSSALARALLAPSAPELRLVNLDDQITRRIHRLAVLVALLQAGAIFVNRLTTAFSSALPFSVAVQGVLTVSSSLLIIAIVRTVNRRGETEEEESGGSLLQRLALVVAGLTAAVAILACLFGFIALGRFLTTQVAWTTVIFALLALLTMLTDELTAAWFRREGVVGSRLVASIGFAPRSATQLGVIINGLLRVLLVALALFAVFAPWGFDSTSINGSLRRMFVGFTVGSIVISPSTIITAVVVFLIGLIATGAFQRWLDTRFLPTTRLDAGLRNSIRTIIGHLGWILAAVIAFGYAGLDLSSIAIVAGALSVGIGLGLQGIVNNFVSGLVLLAERPIRAGDWIVAGSDEGIVKRINIRSTEIETFDRATVIVPNSTLITGPVKNMVLHDRSGRAIVKVVVSKTSDPAVVRQLLLELAKAHPLVLSFPEPLVLFTDFNEQALSLQLVCFVPETGKAGIVASDIRFRCFEEFPRRGIQLPPAFPGDIASPPQIGEHSPQTQS